LCALIATMRAWSGCATSAKITSTMPTSIRYFNGYLPWKGYGEGSAGSIQARRKTNEQNERNERQ
jgi:hypothetical protein